MAATATPTAKGRSGFLPLSRSGAVVPQGNEGLCGGKCAFRARKAAGSRSYIVVAGGWRLRLAVAAAGDAGVLSPLTLPSPPEEGGEGYSFCGEGRWRQR